MAIIHHRMQSYMKSSNPITERELVFYSELHSEIYKSSELKTIDDDKLAELRSEVMATLASVTGVKDEIDAKIKAGIDDYDFDWARRVRGKCRAVSSFLAVIDGEIKLRHYPSQLIEKIKELELALSKAKTKSVGNTKVNMHDKALKSYELEKRKAFYGLVSETIGSDLFEALMDKASVIADRIAPNPAKPKTATQSLEAA